MGPGFSLLFPLGVIKYEERKRMKKVGVLQEASKEKKRRVSVKGEERALKSLQSEQVRKGTRKKLLP